MTHKVFTVYDAKVEAYLNPFLMATKGQAIRAFTDTCNDTNSQFFKHPEDFTLFEIGEFNDKLGEYKMAETKIPLGTALEMLSTQENKTVTKIS